MTPTGDGGGHFLFPQWRDDGFGAHSRLHTAKILRLSEDLPIVVEIVDAREKIDAFMPTVDHAIVEGLATLERVMVRLYRSGALEGQ